jgi:hypothetical protein
MLEVLCDMKYEYSISSEMHLFLDYVLDVLLCSYILDLSTVLRAITSATLEFRTGNSRSMRAYTM